MKPYQLYTQVCEADTWQVVLPSQFMDWNIPKERVQITINGIIQPNSQWDWAMACVSLLNPPAVTFELGVSVLRGDQVVKTDEQLRKENPSLQKAWDNYQTILKLCR